MTAEHVEQLHQPAKQRVERVSAVAVAAVIIGFSTWVLLTLPLQPALILVLASILAFVGWITTNYSHPVRSRKVVATYLCAVAFQLVHMAEEYTGHFPHEIVELFSSPRDWTERSFLLTFVFGFGALWCLAAAGALYQVRVANFMLWFYALGAGMLNAISHFVFPILKGGVLPRPVHRDRTPRDERPADLLPHPGDAPARDSRSRRGHGELSREGNGTRTR